VIVYTDPQGSEAWRAARIGVVSGSCYSKARSKTAKGLPTRERITYGRELARERVTRRPMAAPFETAAMRFGKEQEPIARRAFEITTGEIVSEAGFITTDDRRFGVSVDGLIGADGGIEIKTLVSTDRIFDVLVDGNVSDYLDQCNGAMWLLGRRWWKLILWAPDLEPIGRALTVVHIERDDDAIEALEADLVEFERFVCVNEALLRAAA
jgi:hypothetical protein